MTLKIRKFLASYIFQLGHATPAEQIAFASGVAEGAAELSTEFGSLKEFRDTFQGSPSEVLQERRWELLAKLRLRYIGGLRISADGEQHDQTGDELFAANRLGYDNIGIGLFGSHVRSIGTGEPYEEFLSELVDHCLALAVVSNSFNSYCQDLYLISERQSRAGSWSTVAKLREMEARVEQSGQKEDLEDYQDGEDDLILRDLLSDMDEYARSDDDGWFYADEADPFG